MKKILLCLFLFPVCLWAEEIQFGADSAYDQTVGRENTEFNTYDRGKKEESMKYPEPYSREQKILQLAQTAASSHNSQPWRLEKGENGTYRVIAVEERWLREVDPNKREFFLSLGAYLENLKISAEACGYEASVNLLADDRDDRQIAEFSLSPQRPEVDESMIALMNKASMIKGKYRRKLSREAELIDLLERDSNALWIGREDDRFSMLAEGTVRANREQAANDRKQRELAQYICFSRDEEEAGIGMTPYMLNLPGFMARSWYRKASEATVMASIFRKGASGKAKRQIKNSAGLILLTSDDNSPRALLECGGRFQRLYWEGKMRNIEIHPLSQILEESPWKENLAKENPEDKPIQFLLRAGETDAVTSPSIRMNPIIMTE